MIASSEKPKGNMKILIIEDDEVDKRSILRALDHILPNADIVWAKTLATGLVEASKDFNLILLDLILPDSTNAKDTIAAFAPLMPTIHTIAVSDMEDPTVVLDALDHGAFGFVFKSKVKMMLEQFILDAMEVM